MEIKITNLNKKYRRNLYYNNGVRNVGKKSTIFFKSTVDTLTADSGKDSNEVY